MLRWNHGGMYENFELIKPVMRWKVCMIGAHRRLMLTVSRADITYAGVLCECVCSCVCVCPHTCVCHTFIVYQNSDFRLNELKVEKHGKSPKQFHVGRSRLLTGPAWRSVHSTFTCSKNVVLTFQFLNFFFVNFLQFISSFSNCSTKFLEHKNHYLYTLYGVFLKYFLEITVML